jgi:hypothetical protein
VSWLQVISAFFVRLCRIINIEDCVHHFDAEAQGFTSISEKKNHKLSSQSIRHIDHSAVTQHAIKCRSAQVIGISSMERCSKNITSLKVVQ